LSKKWIIYFATTLVQSQKDIAMENPPNNFVDITFQSLIYEVEKTIPQITFYM
jgi:hypothetical protein